MKTFPSPEFSSSNVLLSMKCVLFRLQKFWKIKKYAEKQFLCPEMITVGLRHTNACFYL